MDIIKEIDFKLILDKATNKIFRFYQEDGTVYDLTGSTVICKIFIDPETPEEITCTTDIPNGKIIVPFTDSIFDITGVYEYIIEETKVSLEVIPLVRGNITVTNYTPFSETIEAYLRSELPASITLSEDYINQRIFYWRRFLYEAFEIPVSEINIENSWPTLVNALLAKLVAYDAIILAMSGSLLGFFGGDYTQTTSTGGGIKSIQTGPAKVEFHPMGDSLSQLFKADSLGKSAFDNILVSLCGLASKLGIKLPMCEFRKTIFVPKYISNPDWAYPKLDEDIPVSRS